MALKEIVERIRGERTDLACDLLEEPGWREARDASGASPLTRASEHLRPARILALLCFGEHRMSPAAVERNTSHHGAGWGNGMEWNLLGEYLPTSVPRR